MLRYDRQTKPGLVALYDIRPGNGAGPFLQPRSPHGPNSKRITRENTRGKLYSRTVNFCKVLWKREEEAGLILISEFNAGSIIKTVITKTKRPRLFNSITARLVVFNGTFSTNRLYRATGVWNISHRAGGEHKYHAIKQRKNTINQHNHKLSSAWALWRRSPRHD